MKQAFLWIWLVVCGLITLVLLYAAVACVVKGLHDDGWKVGGVIALVAVAFGFSWWESYRKKRFKFFFFE